MKLKNPALLTAAILLTINLPGAAPAAPNTAESEPVYLGTETEYASTLQTMFDENGLRKVEVGFNGKGGTLNCRVGLVDRYGRFAAQPIYDEIRLYANLPELGTENVTVLPKIFVGGYTQAKRDGKMGLLNVKGEEVIPCKYDFVGLPAEGMCRVLNKRNKEDWYLGYWNLEQNREVVAPDKYVTGYKNNMIGAIITANDDYTRGKKPAGDYLAVNDFIEGCALVFTERQDTGFNATIVDSNGREVLKNAYYIESAFNKFETYPQKGPYLCFQAPVTIKDREYRKKKDREWYRKDTFETLASGLAGPGGVLIKPTYTTGILAAPSESAFFMNPAEFEILPAHKLIITVKDAEPAYLYGSATGVIDFSGKTVIPFKHGIMFYQAAEKVISGDGTIYALTGKVIGSYDGLDGFFVNGVTRAAKTGAYNPKEDYTPMTRYYVKPDGSFLNVTELLHWSLNQTDPVTRREMSNFSAGGCAWAMNNDRKWGVIDFSGKTVLPFDYDKVSYVKWTEGDNGYAVAEKNGKSGMVNARGKLVVPCSYTNISSVLGSKNTPAVQLTDSSGKKGVADIKTGKILLPVEYDAIGAFAGYKQSVSNWFEMGVYHAKKGDRTVLVDAAGKEVYSTPYSKTVNTHLNFTLEAVNGLYGVYAGSMDNRGRIIIPSALWRSSNLESGSSYTIIVKDKKVCRISANYLDSTYGFKTYAPGKASDTPHPPTEYEKSKKEAQLKALEQARSISSRQRQIRKEPIVQFQHTPSKLLYKTGEAFETAGFKAVYLDIYDNSTDVTKDIELKAGSAAISEGYRFTQAGEKTVDCWYKGKKLNNFKISVIDGNSKLLADGDYHIQLFGKYVAPISASGTFYMELSDKKPAKPFTVKLIKVDAVRGPVYTIRYDGTYVMQPTGRDGAQLRTSNIPHQWRINQNGSFCTIRDYGKQQLLVNAAGEKSANGTKIIVWTVNGSAPDNAKLIFTPAK